MGFSIMQKTYYNKGEANAILSGIANWRNKGIYGRCICAGLLKI